MARPFLTDEQVEEEIEKLKDSPLVKLARRKQRVDYKRRQYLYQLRNYEKEGQKLQDAGITIEMLYDIEKEMSSVD